MTAEFDTYARDKAEFLLSYVGEAGRTYGYLELHDDKTFMGLLDDLSQEGLVEKSYAINRDAYEFRLTHQGRTFVEQHRDQARLRQQSYEAEAMF